MVDRVTDRYYSRVTRYGTSGFLKAKLEHGPEQRGAQGESDRGVASA